MNAERLVVGPDALFDDLYRTARHGTEIVLRQGNFDYFSVSTAWCPGTASGVYIREDDTFSVLANDGLAHVVYEGDERFSLMFPGMRPPIGMHPEDGENPFDVLEWIAGPFGPYLLHENGKELFQIKRQEAKLLYQSDDCFDYRIGMAGDVYIRRQNNFFRICRDESEEKIHEGSCSDWGIGPHDQLVLRRGNRLFFVYRNGEEKKFFESKSSFEWRITPSRIYARCDRTFFRLSFDGHAEEIYTRPGSGDLCLNWEVGGDGIFFHLYDHSLALVVMKC